ncbi:hypothetical protein L6E12_05390 [Actinokineospora sp. PR83]|uniref:hypothetical protein n=1 Tax=Actinokineospora sp. PR83 TaxID=2884908 RepID=UPI001F2F277D|nr:hypothetical protein [Actinokineospora sp. PR83]MCG8915223.1 hypothetical protein [Actinokineospora sp. PR83]
MPQSTETIDELRARLAGLTGPARVEPLSSLAQKLFHRVTTTPLESPSARADLDEAIRCTDEVYGHHRDGDPQRPQVAALLGFMLSLREMQVRSGDDRSRAVALMEEALAHGKFAASYLSVLRVLLAMLLVAGMQDRLMGMVSLSPIDMMAGRRAPAAVPDLGRAEQLLRTVGETPGVSTDVADMADLMLQMCDLMKTMLGLGTRPMDLSSMQGLFTRLATLQRRFNAGGAGVFGWMRTALEPGAGILDVPRAEVPVVIIEEDTAGHVDAPREQVAVAAPPQPTQSDLLRSLVELLSLERNGHSAWDTAARLLLPDSEAPDVETVDTAIALAGEVLESDDPDLSDEDTALAHFVYATALCLRHRADPTEDGADCEFGAQALLSAVRALPADHPDQPVVLRSLGAFLVPQRPLAGLDALAAGFTGRLDALLATGNLPEDRRAELHALRCACRAAFAASELRKAVAALPADYPWPVSLKAAAQLLD